MNIKVGTYKIPNNLSKYDKRHKSLTLKKAFVKKQVKEDHPFAKLVLKVGIPLLVITGLWIAVEEKNRPIPVQAQEVVEVRQEVLPRELPRVIEEHDGTEKLSVEDTIIKYFGKNSRMATAIFKAESNLNPNAIGDINTKYISVGVAQIRLLPERGITKEEMLDYDHNIEYAKMLFDKYGWKPWAAYNKGTYKKFL